MRLLTSGLLFFLLTGCSCGSIGGGVKATVHFGDTDAVCARVFVTGRNDRLVGSLPLVRAGKDLVVGIAEEDTVGPSIDVQARGYGTPDCTGPFVDSSAVEHRDLKPGKVALEVLLILNGGSHPTDGGTDGGVDAGNPDAGVLDGGSPDGGPEQCANGKDDDLDGLTDCFDGDCLQLDCGFGKRCTSIGVCEVPKAELNCADGLDDDLNGKTDCQDPSCNNRSCADTNACTYGEKCSNFVCAPSLTLTCNAPNECQVPGSGACLVDAGCGYSARTGGCDGGTCTNGECVVGFPYTPSNFNPALPASAISVKVTLDCGTSKYNSDTNVFTNWCGRPTPVAQIVNRFGVQNIVVLPMAGFDLKDRLELTGSKPVILAVYGDANLTGDLLASGVAAAPGAGGPADSCLIIGGGGDGTVFFGGGGGGAAYAQNATKGGAVAANAFAGGNGGQASPTLPEVTLRGGCSGGDGAIVVAGQVSAKGGGAGGGLQVSVSGTLTLDGKVAANGGGGEAATGTRAGAGGGGSGGGIVLEASLVHLKSNAVVTANGGGGGGGARNDDDGAPGGNGHDTDANPANGGGGAGTEGGNGGKGGSSAGPTVSTDGTTNGANVGGGGGGGAGAGKIHLRSAVSTCVGDSGRLVSPAATGNCP